MYYLIQIEKIIYGIRINKQPFSDLIKGRMIIEDIIELTDAKIYFNGAKKAQNTFCLYGK